MFSPHFRKRVGGGLKLVGDWEVSMQSIEPSERPCKMFQVAFYISKPFSTVERFVGQNLRPLTFTAVAPGHETDVRKGPWPCPGT